MAINKEGTVYTFIFSIVMVVVVGAGLAFVYESLKDRQAENVRVKKMMDILGALNIESDRTNAGDKYAQYIVDEECLVLNADGTVGDGVAFEVDIKKEYKDKTLPADKRAFPLYVANMDGKKNYVIPCVGSGLWGPIWGYLAIDEDKESIIGAKFDHQGETPGLGAEIKQDFYCNQYIGEKISNAGTYVMIKSMKDGSGPEPGKVDGITGGTITSKGVEEMLDRTLQVYVKYFNAN